MFRVCWRSIIILLGSRFVAQRKANVITVNCHWLVAGMRSFILLSCVVLCHSAWPIPFALRPEALPNVEVSLDAPSNPLPDISAEVSKFDTDRKDRQAINHDKLVRAFNTELVSARLRIASVFDKAEQQFEHRQHKAQRTLVRVPGDAVEPTTSFLSSNIVKVVVAHHKHVHDSAGDAIAQFEHARESYEDAWLEAAVSEMSHLTDVVVSAVASEVSSALRASSSHDLNLTPVSLLQLEEDTHDLGMGSTGANVQVVESNVPYPTVQSLVGTLAVRRDVSENLEKSQALSMYLKLFEFENMLVDAAVKTFAVKHGGARR